MPTSAQTALNCICPYFTMFPLAFPLGILRRKASRGDWVLDPFCGRGTTNFAARLLGLPSAGIDSNPVAAAITAAKLVSVSAAEVVAEARAILAHRRPASAPVGEYWEWAFEAATLRDICALRAALLARCDTPARLALRGILLGALHGPRQKGAPSYLSNQSPRTFAPKPAYALRFWKDRGVRPGRVDLAGVVARRAARYYACAPDRVEGGWYMSDSRDPAALAATGPPAGFRWVITSPPYYGMRTYRPDQWLRNWFLGGKEAVDYSNRDQVVHTRPDDFARDLAAVWRNSAAACAPGAEMVIRFGGIRDRKADPLDIIRSSLLGSGWKIRTIVRAGSASTGKRQADAFLRQRSSPLAEYDLWTRRTHTSV